MTRMRISLHRLRPLLLGALALVVPSACGGEAERDLDTPLLVIGFDGLEWDVMLPMMREGRLPNFAALCERGVCGKLNTLEPTRSPRLWTTIATGFLPETHGILDFARPKRSFKERRRLYNSTDRAVKAFWNHLTDNEISNDTIGWWCTYPVEPVEGWMVAQANTLEREGGLIKGSVLHDRPHQIFPYEREDEMFAVLEAVEEDLEERMGEVFGVLQPGVSPQDEKRIDQCAWAFRADATYVSLLEDRLSLGAPAQVTSIYLGVTDVVGHRFWAAHDPASFGLSEKDPEVVHFGHVVEAAYAYADRALGEVLEGFSDDTTVIVVSDHGMSANRRILGVQFDSAQGHAVTGDHTLEDPGAFIAAGPGIALPEIPNDPKTLRAEEIPVLGSICDFAPTLLGLCGLPYGDDMEGEPIEALLDPDFLARFPLTSVATLEDPGGRDPGQSYEHVDEARLRQLENLGYLQREDGTGGEKQGAGVR